MISENWDHLDSICGRCPSVNQIKDAVVLSPDDDIIDNRMDHDIDSSEQEVEINFQSEINEDESSCQRTRKQT